MGEQIFTYPNILLEVVLKAINGDFNYIVTPLAKAGLFHSLRTGFCQEYQLEILVSRQSKNYCFKQEI